MCIPLEFTQSALGVTRRRRDPYGHGRESRWGTRSECGAHHFAGSEEQQNASAVGKLRGQDVPPGAGERAAWQRYGLGQQLTHIMLHLQDVLRHLDEIEQRADRTSHRVI